jgi:hypothetical protein
MASAKCVADDYLLPIFCYGCRMAKRPDTLKPPQHLSKNPPVPAPEPMVRAPEPDPERLDPVRYGDWEYKGIAVDF